ncbi:hypothetical protein EG329_007296 [Mollisiaceae sp. DMI_Dod_QoI]|nr:hypothetical protein EG329_007296 [Helotiales sp. DMI_Dod_QoI]
MFEKSFVIDLPVVRSQRSTMPDTNKVPKTRASHAQQLPSNAKSKNGGSPTTNKVTGPDLKDTSVNILKGRDDMGVSILANADVKQFEFVTLTSQPTASTLRQTSKTVRKQAMHDYLRKQNRQATTGIVEVVKSVQLREPSRYKGKFKLDTWSHKTKSKAIIARRAKFSDDQDAVVNQNEQLSSMGTSTPDTPAIISKWRPIQRDGSPSRIFSPSAGSLDPFNTLSISLGPLSEKLLVHYNTVYSMNSVAINAECNFFSFVKTDPALFHSILYLVALHRDLWYGLVDSPECLYHGSEAFRIINERLENNFVFDDVTIAAVAMLVNKENLNGRSDFCFSNVWNIQPSFHRLPGTPPTSPIPGSLQTDSSSDQLKPSHLFGASSPIIPIISGLRTLTSLLPPSNIAILSHGARMHASNLIYDTEYSLLQLNPPSPTSGSFTSALANCVFTFESVPLRTALHLYLYVSMRLIPLTSELVQAMVLRLQDSLKEVREWWENEEERKIWLLWILWMGAMAGKGEVRWWFFGEMRSLSSEIGIWDVEGLKEKLRTCVWEEEWCGERAEEVWEDVIAQAPEDVRVDSAFTESADVTDVGFNNADFYS